MAKPDQSLYEQVIAEYRRTESVKKTAENLGTTPITVRRVLITEGLWHSRTSDTIGELFADGVPTEQIAQQLSMSVKNVQAYIPYTRGSYCGLEKSQSSKQSKEYRERKKKALENQVNYGKHFNPVIFEKGSDESMSLQKKPERMIRLRLEIDTENLVHWRRKYLLKYGKVTEGLIREVIVPDTLTLHALHYLIQKCFGWQNSHLHHFALPEDLFECMTENRFARWGELAGIYFRFPTNELDELYYDDNYDGSISFKTWLKRKYVGPYHYSPYSESYLACQKELRSFYKACPQIQVMPSFEEWEENRNAPRRVVTTETATVDDVFRSIMFGSDHRALLERLTIGELLAQQEPQHLNISSDSLHITPVTDVLHYFYDPGDNWEVIITELPLPDEYAGCADEKPVCVHVDGLNVLDDVGGIGGYCDFLDSIHGSNKEEVQNYRQWARSLGWTGRLTAPEKML